MSAGAGAGGGRGERNSFSRAPLADGEEPRNAYDSFGDYFREKNRKLNEQAPALGDACPPLFAGMSMYVDGYTDPSALTLRNLICSHGGKFVYYYAGKSSATHIITSHLPDARVRLLKYVSHALLGSC